MTAQSVCVCTYQCHALASQCATHRALETCSQRNRATLWSIRRRRCIIQEASMQVLCILLRVIVVAFIYSLFRTKCSLIHNKI